jgi:hypothetical protein
MGHLPAAVIGGVKDWEILPRYDALWLRFIIAIRKNERRLDDEPPSNRSCIWSVWIVLLFPIACRRPERRVSLPRFPWCLPSRRS